MSDNNESVDGVDHINVYSRGQTEIGRWLSNFSNTDITTEDGKFTSIEGYWYWLTTQEEELRGLSGWEAKERGKKFKKVKVYKEEEFISKICKAIDIKIKQRALEISKIVLPLSHYYIFNGIKVPAKKYNWIIEHIELRIKQLKSHYNK